MSRNRYLPREQEFYRNYLNSALWRKRKSERLRLAGYRCEFVTCGEADIGHRCTRTTGLCVHHNNYENLGNESAKDLDVYCWFHHMVEHLLWLKCHLCGEPCLANDAVAEIWLKATLSQLSVDYESKDLQWAKLPTKESLARGIDKVCFNCRGIVWEKPD
jgi:hypothetical protein